MSLPIGTLVRTHNRSSWHSRFCNITTKIKAVEINLSGEIRYALEHLDQRWSEDEFDVIERTWDTIQKGDILLDRYGEERTVMATLEEDILFISRAGKPEYFDLMASRKVLEEDGHWSIKQPEEEVTEINGKKYKTSEVTDRLKELTPINVD